jgi:DNA-binding LacI/PurR family transcriptional regulator
MLMPRPVTLLDVAKVAGVSRTTASAALGGTGRVSEATRERVLAVAERLGYAANPAARHLRRGKLGILGLYLPKQVLSLAYYMNFAFGAAEKARDLSFALTLVAPSSAADRLVDVPVDGFLTVDPLVSDPVVQELLRSGLPVVTGERYPGEWSPPVYVVESDHAAGMTELLDHLAEAGARSPALIAPGDESSWARALRAAYGKWCRARGIHERVRGIAFNASADAVRSAAEALLAEESPPDAIVSAPDGGAIGIVGAANAVGRRVGEDLLVAACVDSVTMELASPAITALDLRPREFGRTCVETLVRAVNGEPTPQTTLHPIRLVRRSSTGA